MPEPEVTVTSPDRPPVPWALHYRLQASFAKVAEALEVPIRHGEDFEPIAAKCVERAKAGEWKADQADRVFALVDSAADFLAHGSPTDLQRAKSNLDRALPLLREMAGKGGAS